MKAFVFDLDGTLVNSLDDIADSANYALNTLGYPGHPPEAYKKFIGDGVNALLMRALPEASRTMEKALELKALYGPYYLAHSLDKTRPYPGIVETLNHLKDKGFRLGVVSNKPDNQTKHILSVLFPAGYFHAIAGNQEGYPPKPDPALTLKVMALMEAKPESCYFVGDSGVDMITARASGAAGIGVLWGFRPLSELSENGAVKIISHPGELLTLV